MSTPILEMQGICKAFPGVVANQDANLSVREGEVHAIVGENGAGKTTLMNLLYGLHQPDAGTIRVRGETVQISSPRVAKRLGIGMVHQHFMLVPSFTVAQNVVLGYEPTRKGLIVDRRHAAAAVGALCERYNLSLPLSEPVASLPVGVQQRVEIIKAIYRGANVLILDEPTAVLTPLEVQELFRICREMVSRGKTILFISHKLREVLALSDRVTVMRGGRTVATLTTRDTDEHELARLMVGRDRILAVRKDRTSASGAVALQVKDLVVRGLQQTVAIRQLALHVRAGEILGIAGVEGNGQRELMAALAGLLPAEGGHIRLYGQDITATSPAERRALGIRHIPEDRMETGLCLQASIAENLIIANEDRKAFTGRLGSMRWPAVHEHAARLTDDFNIVASSPTTRTGSLSGGNLQKVVVARELSGDPRCLLLSHPTRGVDIAASDFIYQRLLEARQRGCAILLVSADLDEIFLLSDRIAVMYDGSLVGEFQPDDVSPEVLGLYMTGARSKAEGSP